MPYKNIEDARAYDRIRAKLPHRLAARRAWGATLHGQRYQREYSLMWKFGLTLDQFDAMKERQGNVCAVCKEPFDGYVAVDHDHTTGKVRGLLHRRCNTMVGMARDNYMTLDSAARYVERTAGG